MRGTKTPRPMRSDRGAVSVRDTAQREVYDMKDHLYDPDCPCDYCSEQLRLFDEWCDRTEERWAKAAAEGKVAHVCNGVLCPTCGDPRDTNILPLVLR